MQIFNFSATCFRMIPSPYGESTLAVIQRPVTYQAYVEIQDLPDNFPMDTNPREQNLKTKVAKKIRESIHEYDETFHIKNRGIVLSAKEVSYDTKTRKMTITMDDPEVHGNIDGGHSYKILLQEREDIKEKQYVRVEVITNAEAFFTELAAARNTSVQVMDKAIAELEKKFNPLKRYIDSDLNNDISYKENDVRRINIETIMAILSCFDLCRNATGDSQPVHAYSQKSQCIKNYLTYYDSDLKNNTEVNPFIKMGPIIMDILSLYDLVEQDYEKKYKEAFPGGVLKKVKGVDSKENKIYYTEIFNKTVECKVPKGFIFPIISSFRSLVYDNGETYEWRNGVNPFEYFDKYGATMVKYTVERYRTLGNNPNALGKDTGLWRELFQFMFSAYKDELLSQMNINL